MSQVGRIRYTDPRAVKVRAENNVSEIHSSVYTTLAIYTNTQTETQVILDNWDEIVSAIDVKVNEVVTRAVSGV